MNERIIEQQIKAAYTELHAPEELIRSVILRVEEVQHVGHAVQTTVLSSVEKQREESRR